MGGKPSKATPKDMRLGRNNPNAGKPAARTVVQPPMPRKSAQGGK